MTELELSEIEKIPSVQYIPVLVQEIRNLTSIINKTASDAETKKVLDRNGLLEKEVRKLRGVIELGMREAQGNVHTQKIANLLREAATSSRVDIG